MVLTKKQITYVLTTFNLIVLGLVIFLSSCSPTYKFLIIEEFPDENGKSLFHVDQIGGNHTDVVKLDSKYKEGDMVRLKIKKQ